MKAYIWKGGYGRYHAIALADTIEEARRKIDAQVAKAKVLDEEMGAVEFMSDEWYKLEEEREKVFSDAQYRAPNVSGEPTCILMDSDEENKSVYLKLGNDV